MTSSAMRLASRPTRFESSGTDPWKRPGWVAGGASKGTVVFPSAGLCSLRRDDESLSERMQRRFDLTDMRTVVQVDETPDCALADSQPFGERGVADAFRTHRAVQS